MLYNRGGSKSVGNIVEPNLGKPNAGANMDNECQSNKSKEGKGAIISKEIINPNELEVRLPLWRGESSKPQRQRKYRCINSRSSDSLLV